MFRKPWTLVMIAAVATGCSAVKSSDQTEKEALEQRVAELERKLAESQGGSADAARESAPVPEPPERAKAEPRPAPLRTETTPQLAPAIEPSVPTPVVRAAPTPAPAAPLVIAEDTAFELILENGLSSKTSRPGDTVVARIEQASAPDGAVALPGGSFLEGRVVEARESGRVKGKARVDVAFDRIVVRGRRYSIETTGLSFEADDSHKRDGAIVAGSTAAGAIFGALTGGGAKKGAVLGGAAGGGAVLATRGKEVDLPAGSHGSVRVTRERILGG